MTERTTIHRLQVASTLASFINDRVLPGTGIDPAAFWAGFDAIVHDLAPKNAALLAERDRLQAALDAWHTKHPGPIRNMARYQAHLEKIGYLVPVPADVKVKTKNVDAELALQAGPQLVVPITNARYALNAANARWGSLYDALYGTDALPETDGATRTVDGQPGYNPVRGAQVIEYARHVLDRTAPLAKASHLDATGYSIVDGALVVALKNGKTAGLKKAKQLVGWQGDAAAPSSVLLQHNGLHLDIRIDRNTTIGASDAAGVSDLVLESALSTILDLEDSVAVVDADDKVLAYGNWLGILQGTLTEDVTKGGKTFTRGLNPDRSLQRAGRRHGDAAWPQPDVRAQCRPPDVQPGGAVGPGRQAAGDPGRHPRRHRHHHHRAARPAEARCRPTASVNSRKGSVYIVKPKMHGPAEVAFASELFGRVETAAGPAAGHGQAGHHGRRAPHQRQPQGLHRRRRRPRGLHQHRLPRPHRRRDAHRHAGRADAAQGRHEEQRLDPGL